MRFLITAGGTREYIDPVRFISNASSGKMGFALARAALKAGHKVTLIAAPTSQQPPTGTRVVRVQSAAQMFEAVKRRFPRCDCLIMAAAVSDYTRVRPAVNKIKKTGKPLTIRLRPTADILRWAGKHKRRNQIVVGFALEDKRLREKAQKKLKEKNLDMIIANTPAAIGNERSTVQIKALNRRWARIKNASKPTIAKKIVGEVEKLIAADTGR
ncbi:MAG: phosphopantothenoylcysteine decarboxylase domain-containing protein [Planctomycetota bacterium]|jgi:phosphopantothenoylcysteine decarboxylase/phosphopantothenate--cysteine ligase